MTNIWLAFEQQYRRAQHPFVSAAGASNGKRIFVTTPATHLFSLFSRNHSARYRAALPAHSFISSKYLSLPPTPFTRDAKQSRLDTVSAHSTGLRVQHGKA